jgi:hypothetical protein
MIEVKDDSELTLSGAILYIRKWILFLISKWKVYLIATLITVAAAICIAKFSPKYYVAESNFVHEGAAGAQGDAGSLFAQLGFGANTNAGLFNSNDNILWLYSSNSLISKTLLTEVVIEGKNILLANYFLTFSPEIKNYQNKYPELKGLSFTNDATSFSRNQNKLLRQCVSIIRKEYLSVTNVNQTENIINVKTTSLDEAFSFNFNVTLTDIVNAFYISTKTEQLNKTIQSLTLKADSIRTILDRNIYQVASSIDNTPYVNPNLQTLRIDSQKKGVDVQLNSAIYMQLVQNIETSKLSLAQQTPVIRIVDRPLYPLPTQSISILIAIIVALFISIVLLSLFLILKEIYRDAVARS